MELLNKRSNTYGVSIQTFERWIERGAPISNEKKMVTWVSGLHRHTPKTKTWLKNQGVIIEDKKKVKPTGPLDCAEAFRDYYARKLEEAINDDDHCTIKFWSNLFVEVDGSIRMAEIKEGRIHHKETVKEKRAADYKNLKRTLKCGDVRDDGMVFCRYSASHHKTNFEWWMTRDKFDKWTSNLKSTYEERNPPSKRKLEIRKKKKELSPKDFKKWERATRLSVIKKKACPIEKQKAADRAAKNYQEIKADPVRLAKYKATKAKSATKRYHEKKKHCPLAKLERSVRARLRKRMKSKDTKFTKKFDELIGCTPQFLQDHIESQFSKKMTWDNWGPYWELDHIRPIASFDLTIEKEYLAANHYTNLQPLEKTKNAKKSDDWDGQTEMLSEIL